MRPELRRFQLAVIVAILAVAIATPLWAQDETPEPADAAAMTAAPEEGEETPAADQDEARRHEGRFAVAAGIQHIIPISILKEEVYDINDLKAASLAYGAGFRFFILDELALAFDARRGGNKFVQDKMTEMNLIDAKLDHPDGQEHAFTPDSYLKLDGIAVSLTTYIGDQLTPGSRFNPFIQGSFLWYDWALTESGRGSDVLSYQGEYIEGQDYGVGFGIGTEYAVAGHAALEVGLIWNFLLTGDDIKFDRFQAPNKSYYWTNTNWWGLNANLVLVF